MIQNFQLTWTNNFFFTRILICKKRETEVTVMPSGNSCTGILPRCQNHFGCAGQKDRSSGNENKNRPLRYFFFFLICSCAVRFAALFARKFPFSSPEPLGLICNRPVALDPTENTDFFIG